MTVCTDMKHIDFLEQGTFSDIQLYWLWHISCLMKLSYKQQEYKNVQSQKTTASAEYSGSSWLAGKQFITRPCCHHYYPDKKVYKIKQVSKDFLETQEPHRNLYANHHWYDLIASTLQRHSGNWRETSKTSRKASLIRLKLCQL